jgi:hypothetical protein
MRLVLTMRLAPPGGTHGREGKRAAGECSLRTSSLCPEPVLATRITLCIIRF